MEKILLIGAGGHAKSVVDTIEELGCFEIVGFIDKKEKRKFVYRGYQVIGQDSDLERLYWENGIETAFITIGSVTKQTPRPELYQTLKKIGYRVPKIIDKTAVVAKDCEIDEGTFVGKRVVINSESKIGKMCIINTGAIIEHECRVEDFVHISVGSTLCGQVTVERYSFVGANATIIQGIRIKEKEIIGAGECVRKNRTND